MRHAKVINPAGQALPGTQGVLGSPGQIRDLGAGAVVFDLKDHHRLAAGEQITERINLPAIVRRRELETMPGRPRLFLRLRSHHALTHQHPMNSPPRRRLLTLPQQPVEDRQRPVVPALHSQISPGLDDQPHHRLRRCGRTGQRPPRPRLQPFQALTFEAGTVLVIALPADPQPITHRGDRLPIALHKREHRRVLDLHRDFLHAHRKTLPDRRLGVTDVLSANCYRCPVSWQSLIASLADENWWCRPVTSTHTGAGEPVAGVWRGGLGCHWIVATSTRVCVLAEVPPDRCRQAMVAFRMNGGMRWRSCSTGSPGWMWARR